MNASNEVSGTGSLEKPSRSGQRMRLMPDPRVRRLIAPVVIPPSSRGSESLLHRRTAQIQGFPLFSGISPEDSKQILTPASHQEFSRREVIYQEGDPINKVFLLISGSAKITQVAQNGGEVILRLSGPGELVGKIRFESQARHGSLAQTLGSSTALVWEASVFESLCHRFPALRRNAMYGISKSLEEMEERFREISTEKVAVRLSHEIVRLLDQVGRPVNGAVQISLSREELAQLIGTTLFTVSRLLSDWDERGIVSIGRETVSVSNLQGLKQLPDTE
jgi:CRP/FNR family transcriptional regulator, nitrogen oxide reductase regulator